MITGLKFGRINYIKKEINVLSNTLFPTFSVRKLDDEGRSYVYVFRVYIQFYISYSCMKLGKMKISTN